MRLSFNKAFAMVIGLEGGYSNDPNDPGGETKYGISKRYNPDVDVASLTLEQAKKIYLERYWIPAGCDNQPYPLDICLFDGAVNPQKGGNKELLNQHPEDWHEFLMMRMIRYMNFSKPIYVKGHIFRCLKLYQAIKRDIQAVGLLQNGGY